MTERRQNLIQSENDHDLLIRIDTKLGIMLTQFNEHKDEAMRRITILEETKADKTMVVNRKIEVDQINKDQEDRLRKLERYGAIAVGAIAVLQILLSFFK